MKMREGWGKVKLIDVAHFAKEKISTEEISLRNYISTENMLPEKNGVLVAEKLPAVKKITEFQQGDILFSNIRTYFKKVWFASFDGGASNDVLVIRAKEIVDNKFLYYVLSDDKFIQYSVSTSKGTKMPRGDKNAIMNYEFFLPPLSTQKKIARILSALDDKIELNRQMNRTLEAMAQVIFKSCFVDFDPVHAKAACRSEADYEAAAKRLGISREVLELFPDEFEESELGMIPKGWEVKQLKDFGTIITGKTPSTKVKENYGDKYPFITIPDLHNNMFIDETERYLSELGHLTQPSKLIRKHSLLVSCIATVGLVGINCKDCHTNQQINSIVCDNEYLYFLYSFIKQISEELRILGSAGTATLNVNKKVFSEIKLIAPIKAINDMFFILNKPIFEKIESNTKEIQTLQQTRDILLPKLLSGELDVPKL